MAVIGKYKVNKFIAKRVTNQTGITAFELVLDTEIKNDKYINNTLVCNSYNHYLLNKNNYGWKVARLINFDNVVLYLQSGQKLDFSNYTVEEQKASVDHIYTNKMIYWFIGGLRDDSIFLVGDCLSGNIFNLENAYVEILDYGITQGDIDNYGKKNVDTQNEFLNVYHVEGELDTINNKIVNIYEKFFKPLLIEEINLIDTSKISQIFKERGHDQDILNFIADYYGNLYKAKAAWHTWYAIRYSVGNPNDRDDTWWKITDPHRGIYASHIYAIINRSEKHYVKTYRKLNDWTTESGIEKIWHGFKQIALAPLRAAILLMIKINLFHTKEALKALREQNESNYRRQIDLWIRLGGKKNAFNDTVGVVFNIDGIEDDYYFADGEVDDIKEVNNVDTSGLINSAIYTATNLITEGKIKLPQGAGATVASGITAAYPPSTPYAVGIAGAYEFIALLVNQSELSVKKKDNENNNNVNKNNVNKNNVNNNNVNKNNKNKNNNSTKKIFNRNNIIVATSVVLGLGFIGYAMFYRKNK